MYYIALCFYRLLQKFELFEKGILFDTVDASLPSKSPIATPVQQRANIYTAPKLSPPAVQTGKDHLYKSLLSGFPNEVDFAFNMLVTVSMDLKAADFFKIVR